MKYPLILAALLATAASSSILAADPPPPAAQKAGCMACHSVDKKLVGPAFKDIAAKYKGQGDAVAKLSDKVRKGGAGVWGPIPMPPNAADKISDGDLKGVVEWILKS
ncbi:MULTISPECIES: c-type cytochrome [Zoogloea]|jgi:cytochrome c|uniref:C-type cytochrome n=1 Tax=Zoogloea oleivorans TaxID=1552750 RepID=A0A6C2CHK6_9RHOO|nr:MULTISPECIES: c-type cytochrome [Zoogloea]MBT9496577.1 c-type cytochrome [Zoogloea sp.]MDD2669007.1 c-type cytochrome [Zoogloea sp.]NTV96729.1 c-type cytochrome [Thiobacillus sp.]TYC53590.1 c-type cytochrome [Zoogloea oleivorans]